MGGKKDEVGLLRVPAVSRMKLGGCSWDEVGRVVMDG